MIRTTLTAMCAAVFTAATLPPAVAAATEPLATWEMNEARGATTMTDSSGNDIHGDIGAEVLTGAVFDGATGYRFPRLRPNTPPAHPEHIVRIMDDRLNPGERDYTVEVRYRTTNSFGNLIQKGQAGAAGGYWKIQLPQGEPSCLFRGPTGVTNAVRARTRIDDGQWHTIRCERTTDAVALYVDGVFVGRNRGLTGPIANTKPLYIGGKGECDQIQVTCDYFGGDVDWVRITRSPDPEPPANRAPSAAFTDSCGGLSCSLDGTRSTDTDGTIASYAWDFGDGMPAGSGAQLTHTFAAAGTYDVRLTVTDDRGLQASTTRSISVTAPEPAATDTDPQAGATPTAGLTG